MRAPLTLAIAAVLLVAALALGGVDRARHPAPPTAAHPPVVAERCAALRERAVDGAALRRPPRRQLLPSPPGQPVRVHGRVRRGGTPLTLAEVSFERLTGSHRRGPGDWDLTDADGGYEVRVPPARYAIVHEDDAWIATVHVPRGATEIRLDIAVW